MTEVPAARLTLTRSRQMWHVTRPSTRFYTLCMVPIRPASENYPVSSDICKRCQRLYDREAADAPPIDMGVGAAISTVVDDQPVGGS